MRTFKRNRNVIAPVVVRQDEDGDGRFRYRLPGYTTFSSESFVNADQAFDAAWAAIEAQGYILGDVIPI